MNPLNEILLKELQAYFPEDQVDVRVGPTYDGDGPDDHGGGKPLFYIPARRVQQRLDNVVGPMDWKVDFSQPVNRSKDGHSAGAEATIYIRDPFTGEWVGKSDVSQNTKTEGMKGGYSKGMVRAGVQWGIGRYLYFMPELGWEDLNQYGEFKNTPSLPQQYTPTGGDGGSEFTQDQLRQLRQVSKGKDKADVKEAFAKNRDEGFEAILDGIRSL